MPNRAKNLHNKNDHNNNNQRNTLENFPPPPVIRLSTLSHPQAYIKSFWQQKSSKWGKGERHFSSPLSTPYAAPSAPSSRGVLIDVIFAPPYRKLLTALEGRSLFSCEKWALTRGLLGWGLEMATRPENLFWGYFKPFSLEGVGR